MSYDNVKTNYSREHIYLVELDLEYCDLTHGTAPCTATGTGDARCYNTRDNCQDLPNIDPIVKTYRFCESRSPHPISIDAIPSVSSVSISPAKIAIDGGLGVRASVSVSFTDHPSSDIEIDKYVDGRTYIASDRGTFWTKLRARNPNYQYRSMRVLSGYLINGEFDAVNFQTRYYVIEKMDVSNGRCSITAKDPLKLTSEKKAQVPAPSNGKLLADLAIGATSATLIPAGVGAEYPASGKVRLDKEVMSFTRVGDVLTVTRAQNNTLDEAHGANATAQLCYEQNDQVHVIANDLLTNYANIDPAFIPFSAWAAEVDTYLSGLLDGIITTPTDVFKVLKELAEAMPHYLWWDERAALIQLTALKAPPNNADVLDMNANLIANSVRVKDKPEMRKSTIFVRFAQFDPTKKTDEFSNFQQSYARTDTESITKYTTNEIRYINNRWLNINNVAGARQLAALYGRRFADIPREINFSLDAKDSDVWIGQSKAINYRDIVDASGAPVDTIFQLLSAKEAKDYQYNAIEYTYGGALPEDEGGTTPGVDLIIFNSDREKVNLRTVYDSLFPAPDGSTIAKFVIENGGRLGNNVGLGGFSVDTGSWPAGAQITLQINVGGYLLGFGGAGGIQQLENGYDAGDGLILNYDLELVNNGIIGGGGGGGGGSREDTPRARSKGGGGGAGYLAGVSPGGVYSGDDGTNETGGAGRSTAGDGGDLGQAGTGDSLGNTTGGAAGIAIDKNGYTLTETVTGDIRGSIIT